jgi:hypothetical protein
MELKHREIESLMKKIKQETEAQAISLNLFTICSSCKQKFVVCPFADEENNRRCLFAYKLNGPNRQNGLAHLCA